MPGLCRPLSHGGFGFDYRLNMSVPDKWIQLLKEVKDDNWVMGNLTYTLTNRRWNERHVAYSESHDQSIVGDKTIAMWLFGPEIYTNMANWAPMTAVISRGMALHKMIKMITHALGGEAFLSFMGNEFGHPEWVDFPRQGNGYSHHLCRRQWHLRDDPNLRYHYLWQFDKALQHAADQYNWLSSHDSYVTLNHEEDKIIIFERGGLLWVFNFHTSKSFEHYRVGTKWPFEHIIVLDTDQGAFLGSDRYRYGHEHPYPIMKTPWQGRPNYIQMYIPCRTAVALKPLIGREERLKFGLEVEVLQQDEDALLPEKSGTWRTLLAEELPEASKEEDIFGGEELPTEEPAVEEKSEQPAPEKVPETETKAAQDPHHRAIEEPALRAAKQFNESKPAT